MSITMADSRIEAGYSDITPEQEREIEAREECERRGLDPDEICAEGGVTAWMVIDREWPMNPRTREAIRIADSVMTWLADRGAIDAGNEYRANEIISALNDLISSPPTNPPALSE